MKIAVISASPHKNGTSALLADRFIAGAEEAGHSVFRFNAAFEDIHPCMACDACGMNGPCVQKDAIETKLMPRMLEADLLTLVTPLYYYGMSSQLKMVIDRFYSRTESLHRKKSLFMVTSWNSADWTMTAIAEHYKTLVRYMEWQDVGAVYATGCGYREAAERSEFPEYAWSIGKGL